MTQLSRRHVLLGGLTLAGVAACADKPILADPAEPVPPIHERIEALKRRHNAKIGVYAVDLGSGRSIGYFDGEPFAMCSTFKGCAAARVLQMSARHQHAPCARRWLPQSAHRRRARTAEPPAARELASRKPDVEHARRVAIGMDQRRQDR
jgi:hypothetical protein